MLELDTVPYHHTLQCTNTTTSTQGVTIYFYNLQILSFILFVFYKQWMYILHKVRTYRKIYLSIPFYLGYKSLSIGKYVNWQHLTYA